MEKAFFEKELNKYKIVRLADHYKIRWKLQKKSVPKSVPSSSATSRPILESGVDFWPMIERVNVNAVASEAEMKKFMDALREEYASGMQAHVNLQDLDYMASKL